VCELIEYLFSLCRHGYQVKITSEITSDVENEASALISMPLDGSLFDKALEQVSYDAESENAPVRIIVTDQSSGKMVSRD